MRTLYFTVKELELNVDPPQPTPEGHVALENSALLEIPYVYDEIWEIDDLDWYINEVKIVFLADVVILVVVVQTDLDGLSEEEIDIIARPIAIYAIENGYWEQGRQLEINEKTYPLDEPLSITLMDQQTGQGYRVRLDIDQLLKSE